MKNRLSLPKGALIGVKIFCTIAILAMVLISIAVYRVNVPGLLLFFFFVLFYVQLPGLFIFSLLKVDMKSISANLLVSFFTGWALIVLEYFLCALIHVDIILAATGPIMSVLYIIFAIKKRDAYNLSPRLLIKSIPSSLFIYVTIIMLYVFLVTQFMYVSPQYTSYVYPSIDKAFQMGIITSLTHGFPVVNPWIAGKYINYHIFSQILLSVPVSVFGLDADFVIMSCAPYLTTSLLSLSAYSLFRHFCSNRKRVGLYTLSIILSYLFAARSLTGSYLFKVIIGNDNYGGFALASMASCVIALDICFKQESKSAFIKALVIFVLQIFLLSGIKAPVALVIVGGMIGTALLGLILRRLPSAKTIVVVILSLASFIVIYNLLLNYGDSSASSGGSIFAIGDIANLCFWKKGFIDLLKGLGLPTSVRLVLVMIVFTVVFLTIYTLPFAIGYIREFVLVIRGQKDFDYTRVTIYAAAIVGYVMMIVLGYEGNSQIYFGSVLMFFAPLITFWFFEDVGPSSYKFTRLMAIVSKVWFFTLIIFTSCMLTIGIKDMIPDAVYRSNPESNYNEYRSMTAQEYEATKWIKENVPYETLISTQMYASVSPEKYDVTNRWDNCHFLYAAFSDHRFYLEGSGFSFGDSESERRLEMVKNTDMLYDPANDSRGDLASELGIGYVMVTKKLHPTPDLSSDDYDLVFSNKDVDIYKVAE